MEPSLASAGNPYHEPGGTPVGGRFAHRPGGGVSEYEARRWLEEGDEPYKAVLYHGTTPDAATSIMEQGLRTKSHAVWLTDAPEVAGQYADIRTPGRVVRAAVKLRNPLILNNESEMDWLTRNQKETGISPGMVKGGELERLGYDGVVINDRRFDGNGTDQIVQVFDPAESTRVIDPGLTAAATPPAISPAEFSRGVQAATRIVEAAITSELAAAYEKALRSVGPGAARRFAREAVPIVAAGPNREFVSSDDPMNLVPKAQLAAEIEKRTADLRRQVVTATVSGVLTQAGVALDVGGIFSDAILARVGARVRDAELSTRDAIRTVIDRAQREGWSVPQTATEIRTHIDALAPSTATQLARTDLIGTSNASAVAAARLVFPTGTAVKRWLATPDERTRETHHDANGQQAPLEGRFRVGDALMDFPGDPDGPDAEVCNCRCTVLFEDRQPLAASAWDAITAAFDPAKHPRNAPSGRDRKESPSDGGKFKAKVGVTPFRPEDDEEGFYDSAKFKDFEKALAPMAAARGVTIDGRERTAGFWMGDQEPSMALDVHDGEEGVRLFAEDVRGKWDQDGVLLFHPDPDGDDFAFTVPASGDKVSAAITAAGIDGATIHGDRVVIYGDEDTFVNVKKLAEALGVDPADIGVGAGTFALIERKG